MTGVQTCALPIYGGAYQSDGTLTYSLADTGTVCSVDPNTGIVTADGSYGTCKVKSVRTAGNYYDSVTSAILSITISKADTFTVTMGALTYETYTGSTISVSDKSFTVTGLVNSDHATSPGGATYYYYDSITTCAQGGACVQGDVGPGGGIVFYVSPTLQPWGRYLEMETAYINPASWCKIGRAHV